MMEVKSSEDFQRLKKAVRLLCELCNDHNDFNFLRYIIRHCVKYRDYPDAEADIAEHLKPKLRVIHTDKK